RNDVVALVAVVQREPRAKDVVEVGRSDRAERRLDRPPPHQRVRLSNLEVVEIPRAVECRGRTERATHEIVGTTPDVKRTVTSGRSRNTRLNGVHVTDPNRVRIGAGARSRAQLGGPRTKLLLHSTTNHHVGRRGAEQERREARHPEEQGDEKRFHTKLHLRTSMILRGQSRRVVNQGTDERGDALNRRAQINSSGGGGFTSAVSPFDTTSEDGSPCGRGHGLESERRPPFAEMKDVREAAPRCLVGGRSHLLSL